MSGRSDCSILRNIDPSYAALVEEACDEHDALYKHRTGLRLVAELKWIARAAELSGQPIKTMFYGTFTILFGWWLWYDLDQLFRFKK